MKTPRNLAVAVFVIGFVMMSIAAPAVTDTKTPKMKMTTPIPDSITTPDKVQTSIGKLEFVDGFPTEATIQKSYDYLDTMRAVDVFLNSIPVASLVAVREGFKSVGVTDNTIGIFDNFDSLLYQCFVIGENVFLGYAVQVIFFFDNIGLIGLPCQVLGRSVRC